MAQGTASKVIDTAFDGMHKAAPHIINATKVVMHKVVLPAGLSVFAGATSLLAMIVAPKRKAH